MMLGRRSRVDLMPKCKLEVLVREDGWIGGWAWSGRSGWDWRGVAA